MNSRISVHLQMMMHDGIIVCCVTLLKTEEVYPFRFVRSGYCGGSDGYFDSDYSRKSCWDSITAAGQVHARWI